MATKKTTAKAAEVKAQAVKSAEEVKPAEVKAEVKPAEVKAAPKAAEKKADVKAEAKPAEVKAAPKAAEKKAEAKPAAKTAAKKPAAKKPAAKKAPAKKAAPKAAEKKAAAPKAAKPAAKKAKEVTLDDICAKLAKLVNKANAAKLAGTIAVDVEVWGWDDGSNKHLYVEVKDGVVTVAPYEYNECSVKAYIAYADAVALVNGKLTFKDAFTSGKLNAIGIVGDAVKLASLF